MRFRPLHDRVVVKRLDQEEKTAGGIIIPDTAKEKPSEGEVIAVGPGARDEAGKVQPLDVKTAADYGVDVTPRLSVVSTSEPSARKAGVMVADVAELVSKLKNEAGVL